MKKRISIPLKKLINEKKSLKPQKPVNETNKDQIATPEDPIKESLSKNIHYIKEVLGNSSDIVIREFQIGENGEYNAAIIYTDGLSDNNFVQEYLLETLMVDIRYSKLSLERDYPTTILDVVKKNSLPIAELKDIYDFQNLFLYLLSGDSIFLIDGFSKGFVFNTRGWSRRGVEEPSTQTVVRGPKDGFTETLRINTALIRRRIKDPNLRVESMQIGTRTQTDIAVMYIQGLASEKIIEEVHYRLDKIDVDAILESGYIEELIEDNKYSPFPTVFNSERPDSVAAALLEGRIAIIVDGTPFVLVIPALFTHFFQASEDYYNHFDISSFIRLLRYFAFFLVLLTPSAYIAVTTFHQEMLPTRMLISLAAQREGVPLPAIIEALMMEITFELLREAGVRMPRAVGSAISIVGALVIGQAAVEAGIVSASMVIVVSLTAISSFVSPSFNMSITARLLRFPFMILAATFGLFGILLGLIVMVLHLNSVNSFGIPYLTPTAPFVFQDQKDNLIRLPKQFLWTRPKLLNRNNTKRSNIESHKASKE